MIKPIIHIPPPMVEEPHFCQSHKEHVHTMLRDFFSEPVIKPALPPILPAIIVPELVQFGVFMIEYSNPDPLPDHIKMLMRCNTRGLEVVRIPVAENISGADKGYIHDYEHRNYLLPELLILMTQNGANKIFTQNMIREYQTNPKIAAPLYAAYQLAKYHAEIYNYEFL